MDLRQLAAREGYERRQNGTLTPARRPKVRAGTEGYGRGRSGNPTATATHRRHAGQRFVVPPFVRLGPGLHGTDRDGQGMAGEGAAGRCARRAKLAHVTELAPTPSQPLGRASDGVRPDDADPRDPLATVGEAQA